MKSKIRQLLAGVCVGIMALSCVACTSTSEVTTQAEETEDDTIQIGLSIDSLVIERWQRERDLFVSKAQELGAEVNVQNASGDVDEQIRQNK